MNSDSVVNSGGCHCGAIRYEVIGEPDFVGCCHCKDCRGSTGAPITIYPTFPEDRVQFTKGERKKYESSPGVFRTFCSHCGTPISFESPWDGKMIIGVHVSTLDRPEKFPPDKHVFDIDRIQWFDTADHLPRYATLPSNGEPVRYGPDSK